MAAVSLLSDSLCNTLHVVSWLNCLIFNVYCSLGFVCHSYLCRMTTDPKKLEKCGNLRMVRELRQNWGLIMEWCKSRKISDC